MFSTSFPGVHLLSLLGLLSIWNNSRKDFHKKHLAEIATQQHVEKEEPTGNEVVQEGCWSYRRISCCSTRWVRTYHTTLCMPWCVHRNRVCIFHTPAFAQMHLDKSACAHVYCDDCDFMYIFLCLSCCTKYLFCPVKITYALRMLLTQFLLLVSHVYMSSYIYNQKMSSTKTELHSRRRIHNRKAASTREGIQMLPWKYQQHSQTWRRPCISASAGAPRPKKQRWPWQPNSWRSPGWMLTPGRTRNR